MKFIKPWVKVKNFKFVFFIFCISIFLYILISVSGGMKKKDYYTVQFDAAQRMEKSINIISSFKLERFGEIDTELDPNKTGLIGGEFTKLTTTLGDLSAKRTSTNPDFAALIVDYFYNLGLKEGDYIAVGSSGSFPSLALAVMCAAESMKLNPIFIYSIGSSMYGANLEDFTFLDMYNKLVENNILRDHLAAVSKGGVHDQAAGMLFPDSVDIIDSIALSSGKNYINEPSLVESISKRMEIYDKENIKVFVNVGGASANFGNITESISFPNGLTVHYEEKISDDSERGLIFEYLDRGIPVIHLLNIIDLALKNGISIDPVPLPEIGKSEIYFQKSYNTFLIVGSIIFVLFLIFIYGFIWRKK